MIPALALSLFFLFLLHHWLFRPLFLSPLRHVPAAHWSCRYSSLWALWKRYRFHENAALFAAHRQHGPVVLLAPNELSVNCVDHGIRTIYSGAFDKHQMYSNLFSNFDGVPVMFSMAASAPHSTRKRMLSNTYSKSSIQSSPAFKSACDNIIYNRLSSKFRAAKAKALDARRLFESMTMDIVSSYLLGPQNASNFLENPDEAAHWLELYQRRKSHVFWYQELPKITSFFAKLGLHLSPKWISAANRQLESWCLRLCDAAESQVGHDSEKPSVYSQLRTQFSKTTSNGSAPLSCPDVPPRIHIASEMLDHLSAGHETSAITLTFLFHELSLRPAFQAQLRRELQTIGHFPQAQQPPSPKQLDTLPLLHATLLETLRLHPAIPGPQPRLTPPTPGGVTLGSYHKIPAGVRVSASAYCLHRNPVVFADPESWRPERWLRGENGNGDEEARLAEQHRWLWAFSSGGRMCIGSHLAMAQMKAITAALLAAFEVQRVAPLVDTHGAEPFALVQPFLQQDAYTAQPVEAELLLRFVPLGA